jgi:DNA primase
MNNFAETVRNSADIVQVVSEYVSLKGSGNRFSGLCPFHSEKTPSFSVSRDKQLFYCYGCHAGGDIFEFVKKSENVSFPEALRIIAEKCNIPIPTDTGDPRVEERKQLFEICDRAASYFSQMLSTAEAGPARQVLEKRKINAAFAERFRLGYAPSSGLLGALRPKDPLATGLFAKNDSGETYDRFRRRLMFPIWNERGKTIGFGGRALGEVQPKYLNSAESPLYSKSYVLYALHLARDVAQKAHRMVVVEGYFDCLSLHQNGIENVVASCGTSLTTQQVSLMARYVPEVVMNYDPDSAGQNAMRRSIDLLLARGLRIRILKLPGGLDPDDFVRKEGGEVYKRLLDNAPTFWQYLIIEAARQFDLDQPDMKANAVNDVMQSVSKIQDRVEQLEVARAVAESFKVPESLIFERLKISPRRLHVGPSVPVSRLQVPAGLSSSEKQLIHGLLQQPDRSKELEHWLETGFLREAWSRQVIEQLIKDPTQSIETVLEPVSDDDLRSAVRAAVLEPFGVVSNQEVRSSAAQLYEAHLVKKEKEIREKIKSTGSQAESAELLKTLTQIVNEKLQIRALSLENNNAGPISW